MFSTELQEEENEDTAVQSDIFPQKLLLFLFIPTAVALIWATIIAQLVHCSSRPTVFSAPEACSFLIYFITLRTEWTFYRANVISPLSFKSFFQSLLLLTCKDPVSSGLGLLFILISQLSLSCSLGSSHAVTRVSFNIKIWHLKVTLHTVTLSVIVSHHFFRSLSSKLFRLTSTYWLSGVNFNISSSGKPFMSLQTR